MRWALTHGIEAFLEPGPGTVLAGLLRRISKDLEKSPRVRSIEHPADLEERAS